MVNRTDIRNIAIVAHVDHGKTTLVDQMLRQTNTFDSHAEVENRVMDSGQLEKEKGITILAKNTSIEYNGKHTDKPVIINVIDTPGHADFAGEVERGLSMVDGVVLLVDASEGPLPQTRFVLRKALEKDYPVIICVNKVDRPDSRISEVVKETQDLLLGLAQDISDEGGELNLEKVLEVPVIFAAAKIGASSSNKPKDGQTPDNLDLEPLFKEILEFIPGPKIQEDDTLLAQVTNLDASQFLGRLALIRIYSGHISKGQNVAWISNETGETKTVKITELLETQGLKRVPVQSAKAGDIMAIAGIPEISIGDTLADLSNAVALPKITIDPPSISATIGINTSPIAGVAPKDPKVNAKDRKVTARQIKDRLDKELVGNISMKVLPTEKPDAWEVQARGELALAILVEQMRREGFELTVGKPKVVIKSIDGIKSEPFELVTIDIPEEYMGEITQLMAARKGTMLNMANHGSGWIRLEFSAPTRGLIGIKSSFMTQTRGTGIMSSLSDGYKEYIGELDGRINGSLVQDRAGVVTPFSMIRIQERGQLFVDATQEVYEGMIVGQNSRSDDMIVNLTKEKELTNMRSATADISIPINPPKHLTLEESLEFAANDECVEVTPEFVRIRKVILQEAERRKQNRK